MEGLGLRGGQRAHALAKGYEQGCSLPAGVQQLQRADVDAVTSMSEICKINLGNAHLCRY